MERIAISEVRQKPTRVYLEDGTVIELNIQVIEAHKTGEVNQRGEPVYQLRHNLHLFVCPKEGEQDESPPPAKVSVH